MQQNHSVLWESLNYPHVQGRQCNKQQWNFVNTSISKSIKQIQDGAGSLYNEGWYDKFEELTQLVPRTPPTLHPQAHVKHICRWIGVGIHRQNKYYGKSSFNLSKEDCNKKTLILNFFVMVVLDYTDICHTDKYQSKISYIELPLANIIR